MAGAPALTGLRVLEFAGLAPGPFAGMLLADNGASVLRVDRAIAGVTHPSSPEFISEVSHTNPQASRTPKPTPDPLARHKSSIAVDLKSPAGIAVIRTLIPKTDVLIDPFRPGVLEKLGLGPSILSELNPRLIYARITGFRRSGRYADMAGHDINYLSVSGVLSLLGRKDEKPYSPANILGDFAGGGAVLFQGILLAILARETSGKGQVVEANMVDGVSYLASFPRMLLGDELWNRPRGENVLDGGCPWYDTYETKDGKFMAVGALEEQFFRVFLQGLGLDRRGIEKRRSDRKNWPELRALFTAHFKEKTRDEWEAIFDGTDACCTPVLDFHELQHDGHREGDQRASVTLTETPALRPEQPHGKGFTPSALYPGQGGEAVLSQWLGWQRGRDFIVVDGGLRLKPTSKL